MTRLKIYGNGSRLFPADGNAIEDDYECALSTYKPIFDGDVGVGVITSNFTNPTLPAAQANFLQGAWAGVFWLDPALYWADAATHTVNPRTVKYNMRMGVTLDSGFTAPIGVTIRMGLYPVTGTTSSGPYIVSSVGSVVARSILTTTQAYGSGVAIPPAYSGDFTAPAAGYYAFIYDELAGASGTVGLSLDAGLFYRQV